MSITMKSLNKNKETPKLRKQTFTQKEKNFKKENLKHYNYKRKKKKELSLPAMGSLADGGGRLCRGKGHEKEII